MGSNEMTDLIPIRRDLLEQIAAEAPATNCIEESWKFAREHDHAIEELRAALAAPVQGEAEIWVDVPGFSGVYEVSSFANVRRKGCGHNLKLCAKAGAGYIKCTLHSGGDRVQTYLHRVVCEAFNGPSNGREVNHIDGNKENNLPSNLEWVTRSENVNHGYYVLGNKINSVIAFNEIGEEILFASIESAVRLGFDSAHIYRCINNTNRSHKGYKWRRPDTPPQPADVGELVSDLKFLAEHVVAYLQGRPMPNYLALGRYPFDVAKAALAKLGEKP